MGLEKNRHLDEIEIEKYSRGETAEADAAWVEEHLLICEACQNLVAESDDFVGSMQAASARIRLETKEKKGLNRPFFFRMTTGLALAACLVIGVSVAVWMRGGHSPPAEPTTLAMNLVAVRGSGVGTAAPAGRPLALQLDLTGLANEPSLRLEVVDQIGKVIWQSTVVPSSAKALANVPQLSAGTYFVRVYDPTAKLLREFGLEVQAR